MNRTSIEWTDYTWNPVTGCTKVSQGCKNCYAETMTKRFAKPWGVKSFRDVVCHPKRLMEPCYMGEKLHGKKVFVCDMSDLFHEDVPVDFIAEVFETIHNCPDTIFQILTKRPDRALKLMPEISDRALVELPLPNVWIGTSCEDQATADERIPLLLQIPAAVRFLSCEPVLGPIDVGQATLRYCAYRSQNDLQFRKRYFEGRLSMCKNGKKEYVGVDWVIAGGESGRNARPMHPDWVRSLRDQCAAAGVPFFFKQWGEWEPDSHVSFNGPFFIHGVKHRIVNIDGRSWPWVAIFDPTPDECPLTKEDNAYWMAKTGKHKSGNYLDGKQHLEFPKSFNYANETSPRSAD